MVAVEEDRGGGAPGGRRGRRRPRRSLEAASCREEAGTTVRREGGVGAGTPVGGVVGSGGDRIGGRWGSREEGGTLGIRLLIPCAISD